MPDAPNRYRWYLLALIVLTTMLNVTMPTMAMSVFAKDIALDLDLNLVQVGIVWGIGALPGVIFSMVGGAVGDMLGPKRVLVVATLVAGLLGAARGLAPDFFWMTVIVILQGGMLPVIMMNSFKTASQWFPSHQLALANALIGIGMALGFFLGAVLSATVLAPLLGGWRLVLIAYGLAGAVFAIPWALARIPSNAAGTTDASLSVWKAVQTVAGIRDVRLLGLALFCVFGAMQGLLGYLPLYLRNLGWQPASADGALSVFNAVSLLFVLPLSLLSNRLGSRKFLLLAAGSFFALGTGLLNVANDGWIWAAVLLAGFVRDGFMALFLTMTIETDGVGATYAGSAAGYVNAWGGLGNVVAPPLGNSLAAFSAGSPFALWAALAVAGMACLALTRRGKPVAVASTAAD